MNVTDNDCRNISVYNFSSPIVDMVLFKENDRKHVGILCEKTFFIIDLEQKRTKRKIQLEDTYELLKFKEYSLILSRNRDHTIDVFGERSAINMPQGFTYKNAFFNGANTELLFSRENELIAINSKGQFIGQKTLSCASIDQIAIYTSENRPIKIGVLDGIENKIVLLVDDSLVRGTTSFKIIKMLYDSGAKEVHMRIASPQIKFPDFYGVDTPTQAELLASNKNLEEMCDHIGAKSLNFLTIDNLYKALGYNQRNEKNPQFTDHYFTGEYPVRPIDYLNDNKIKKLSSLSLASNH